MGLKHVKTCRIHRINHEQYLIVLKSEKPLRKPGLFIYEIKFTRMGDLDRKDSGELGGGGNARWTGQPKTKALWLVASSSPLCLQLSLPLQLLS